MWTFQQVPDGSWEQCFKWYPEPCFSLLLPASALSIRTMFIILGPCLMEAANEPESSAPNTSAPLCCLRKQIRQPRNKYCFSRQILVVGTAFLLYILREGIFPVGALSLISSIMGNGRETRMICSGAPWPSPSQLSLITTKQAFAIYSV